ncbi:hypothetical protein [Synechococcus sp. MIT S1220]|uniref:hypothetical protein n=1 Tax=Synechococcus sp. MIT S1220 TaxID=3082549 RepID=UPI0039AFBA1A
MPWWTSCILLGVSLLLWFKGRGNADDVIGLLEKILGTAACMVVLLFGHNLLLELLILIAALRLPSALERHVIKQR